MIATMDKPPRSLAEIIHGGSAGRSLIVCPECGKPVFFAANTYYLVDGTKRRLRKCRFCQYAASETVPEPIPDAE